MQKRLVALGMEAWALMPETAYTYLENRTHREKIDIGNLLDRNSDPEECA